MASATESKMTPAHRSYAALAEVFGMLPMSVADIAERTTITVETLLKWMTDAESLGMVYMADVVRTGRSADRVFALGKVEGPWPKWTGRARKSPQLPGARLRTLARLWFELEGPGSVPELSERTGIHSRVINDLVLIMRNNNLARIVAWDLSNNNPVALWGRGPGADARRPSKVARAESRKKSNAKYWAGRRERLQQLQMLQALGFAANRQVAQAA